MTDDPTVRSSLRFGWTAVAIFLLLGIGLETLHLFKAPLYLESTLRRELWTLAHAHGTLLGLLNVVFALAAERCLSDPRHRRRAGWMLRIGAALVPLGFFLGGIGNAEGDPSPAILLVPVGAVAALLGVSMTAWSTFRNSR